MAERKTAALLHAARRYKYRCRDCILAPLSPFYLLRSSCLIQPAFQPALWREGNFFVFVELGARLDVSPCLPTMELFYKQAWEAGKFLAAVSGAL